jgi:hypothetical protein
MSDRIRHFAESGYATCRHVIGTLLTLDVTAGQTKLWLHSRHNENYLTAIYYTIILFSFYHQLLCGTRLPQSLKVCIPH